MSDSAAALLGDNGGAADGGAANNGAADANAWNAGFDETTNEYINGKGWKGTGDVIESYRNLEKFAGGSKKLVELPGVDADADAMSAFYGKLGRPDDAAGYGLELPDGGDQNMMDWYTKTAHENGLTSTQAKAMFDSWNEMSGGVQAANEEQIAAQSAQEIKGLEKEWGKEYENNINAAQRAAKMLGYDEQGLTEIEGRLGTGEMLKLFAKFGNGMGEDSFASGDGGGDGGFGLTPARAQQQIADLKADQNFMNAYLSGDKDAIARMQRLNEAAYA